MRNALVVLVPLCFGLASGFIVPTGMQEIMTDLKDSLNSSTSKTRNMLLLNTAKLASTGDTTASIFPEKLTNSFQKDLYENSQAKDVELKTRAYIYIKQHGRKPNRNRPYNSHMNIPQSDRNSQKSYMMNFNVFEELPRQFSIGFLSQNAYANTKSRKPDHRCNTMRAKQDSNEAKSKIKSESQKYKTLSNEQREFLELLKTPSFTPEVKNDKRIDNLKQLSTNHQKSKPYYSIHPYETLNNINLKGKVRDEVIPLNRNGQKNYQKGVQGDGSLLDELIKQKLGEDGSLFVCDDCLNKARRSKLRSGLHLEPMCKCSTSNLLSREVEMNKQ